MYRSSLDAETARMEGVISSAFEQVGATVEKKGSYEAWEPKFGTELVKKASAIFEEMFISKPKVVTIHAGLELAIISKKVPADTEMFSFGPEMKDVHTTGEWVDIVSVQKFWDFLQKLLVSL
jgi:dipeptidase D